MRRKKIILALFCKIDTTQDPAENKNLYDMLETVVLKYLFMKVVDDDIIELQEHSQDQFMVFGGKMG